MVIKNEIKFRAVNKKGEFLYGIPYTHAGKTYMLHKGMKYSTAFNKENIVDGNTCVQFAKIIDDAGNELYYNDIVRVFGKDQVLLCVVDSNFKKFITERKPYCVLEKSMISVTRHVDETWNDCMERVEILKYIENGMEVLRQGTLTQRI